MDENLSEASIIADLIEKGWSCVDRFLFPEQVRQLAQESLSLLEKGAFRPAGVGKGAEFSLRPEVRGDWICWLDPGRLTTAQREYWRRMEQLRRGLNRELYLGLNEFEAHLAIYPPGAFYRRHLDQFSRVKERIISCILYLNHNWRPGDGGRLRIFGQAESEQSPATIETLPEGGRFVCFFSDRIYHEVLPSRRRRISVTGWLKRVA